MFKIFVMYMTVFFMSMNMMINFYYDIAENEQDKAKSSLILASKVLKENMFIDESLIIDSVYSIRVDQEQLLEDFEVCLSENYNNYEAYIKASNSIKVKVLVYPDYFVLAGPDNQWSMPYYFWVDGLGGEQCFLNTIDNSAYYYGVAGNRIDITLADLSMTEENKVDFIIDKLNGVVGAYTVDRYKQYIGIKIQNPFNMEQDYKLGMQSFNVLDGPTFYVVYDSGNEMFVLDEVFKMKSTELVGYTLDI